MFRAGLLTALSHDPGRFVRRLVLCEASLALSSSVVRKVAVALAPEQQTRIPIGPKGLNANTLEDGPLVQVLVRDNNVDQALRALKKKMQREGIFREMKLRNYFEKPSEKKAREKAEAIRRARKLARKKLQREGLLPGKPVVKPGADGKPGTGGPGGRPPRPPRPAF